ncbi:NDR1/HIN1-like protein 12 [Cinnamomum micranthum f. kanehirae]|uniref:NDR1/HIN1-like protein 12 n=1 Tax=Cinnamomum micranthum f. kanehirae TaxID=337451 RepID=A0A443NRH7_9MAGN|nr:NDR1/HIN1-like protein 12 [Cinnamomum micranthum f. kanehirae]
MPSKQNPKLHSRSTHPLIWLIAILCTIIAIAVVFAGIAIFTGYLILRPKLPYVRTSYAHLESLNYDQYGNMDAKITIHITAVNENSKVHASFSDLKLALNFQGVTIANLVAEPFDVEKNSTFTLPYVVETSSIVLQKTAMDEIDASLKRNKISFILAGDARTRWKVGIIGAVKFWTHLYCQLDFSNNGTSIDSPQCSSKSD